MRCSDAVGINTAVSKLEEAYFLAVETDRDADFNRPSLFRNVLCALFPHLRSKWASKVAEAQTKGEKLDKFEDFVRFLNVQKHHAAEMKRMPDQERSEKSSKPTKKTAQKEKDEEEGFSKVEKKARKPRQAKPRQNEPRECSLCDKEKHWLHDCKKFLDMEIEDRWEYCTERSICPRCLRSTHKLEACTFVAKCKSCGGGHNHVLHGAKDMSEKLKRPMEVNKQA